MEINAHKSTILFNELSTDQERRIIQTLPFNVSSLNNGVKYLGSLLITNDYILIFYLVRFAALRLCTESFEGFC